MATVNLDDATAHVPELILGLNPGDELVIDQERTTLGNSHPDRDEPLALQGRQCEAHEALDGTRL